MYSLFFLQLNSNVLLNSKYLNPMAHTLPSLPYAEDALIPFIDQATMEIHHGKHHKAYVDNLNNALAGHKHENATLEELMAIISTLPPAVRNNGGGHYNHSLFWQIMAPPTGQEPVGIFAEAIETELGGLEKMKSDMNAAGMSRFGSGWVWLCVKADKTLCICSTPNQDNPLMDIAECPGTPILGIDVWEHAYYLNYQNKRADYLAAFWSVVNWKEVNDRYVACM
jgi:Fe-Mn family superoxide dismutase